MEDIDNVFFDDLNGNLYSEGTLSTSSEIVENANVDSNAFFNEIDDDTINEAREKYLMKRLRNAEKDTLALQEALAKGAARRAEFDAKMESMERKIKTFNAQQAVERRAAFDARMANISNQIKNDIARKTQNHTANATSRLTSLSRGRASGIKPATRAQAAETLNNARVLPKLPSTKGVNARTATNLGSKNVLKDARDILKLPTIGKGKSAKSTADISRRKPQGTRTVQGSIRPTSRLISARLPGISITESSRPRTNLQSRASVKTSVVSFGNINASNKQPSRASTRSTASRSDKSGSRNSFQR